MAFTDVQKRDIRKYLGAAFGFYDLNTRLESMMDTIGANSDDQDQVEEWLTRLGEIDTALTGSGSSTTTATYGALKKVDEIEFYNVTDGAESAGASSIALVAQGRLLIDRIARAFGCDDHLPNGDYFGTKRPLSRELQLG